MNAVTPLSPYPPMNAQLKAKWIEKLESGEYEQGRGQLRDRNDSYCCLGVLYEAAGCKWQKYDGEWSTAEVIDEEVSGDDDGDLITIYPDAHTLTSPFRKQFGLDHEAESELIELNDTARYDFKKIANWIKENL